MMSFMGSIGSMVKSSALQEAIQIVNIIAQMMPGGKAAVRGQFLVDSLIGSSSEVK